MLSKYLKSSFWVLSSNLIVKLINFLTISFIANNVNVKTFGTFTALISIATSVNQFCSIGTDITMHRTCSLIKDFGIQRVGSRISVILILQLILNLIISFILFFWDDYFFKLIMVENGDLSIFRLLGLIIILQLVSEIPLRVILGLGEFKNYAIRMIVTSVISLSFLLLFVFAFESNVKNLAFGLIVSLLVNSIITWWVVKVILFKNRVYLNFKNFNFELKSIINESFIYYLGNVLVGAISNLILVSYFSKYIGITEFGFIRISSSIIALLSIIPTALQPVTITFLSEFEKSNNQRIKSIQIRYLMTFTIVLAILIMIFIDPIIELLFGNTYLKGRNVYLVMLSIQIMITLLTLVSNFLVASGNLNYVGIASIIGASFYGVLIIILIPIYQLNGYFFAYFIGYGLGFLILIFKEFRNYRYSDLREIINVLFILALGLFTYLCSLDYSIVFQIVISILFLISSLLIFYKMVMTVSEKNTLKSKVF